ncbi:hypothetical protein Fmac_021757 [Flemingia macrophylla]|uniref:Uncharacterized protein n=1 Tax=Flemingia macrophylla TaxID=520843 RepID=A0ABD1LXT5_9FABA
MQTTEPKERKSERDGELFRSNQIMQRHLNSRKFLLITNHLNDISTTIEFNTDPSRYQ